MEHNETPSYAHKRFVAHRRKSDFKVQEVYEHLLNVERLTRCYATTLGFSHAGRVIGLLHDLGKYSADFQHYFDPGYSGGEKVDHSTAGAQFIWQAFAGREPIASAAAQALSLVVASHHGGLIDCLSPIGYDVFGARMQKPDRDVHLKEACQNGDEEVISRARECLANPDLVTEFTRAISGVCDAEKAAAAGGWEQRARVVGGLLLRALFSCLIDADRTDTADFENPTQSRFRTDSGPTAWKPLIARLESHLKSLVDASPINVVRRRISVECRRAAIRSTGVFTLTVPTGGGRTLASLRFALRHAKRHDLDRIVYVLPFTTIIDQNAQDARDILEGDNCPSGYASIVLEHHSNLTPEEETPRSKLLSDNWDAPVIYTTMVQLLESLFGAGTRGVRRMHRLANSVIVFDEVQALPVTTVHLFCNAVNFLTNHCHSTVVLCTATQPLLDRVDPAKGAIRLTPVAEIIPDVVGHFGRLERVRVSDRRRVGRWSNEAIIRLAEESVRESGSCLVIVNTKRAAMELYQLGKTQLPDAIVCHLSTGMCPAHRLAVLGRLYEHIGRRGKPPRDPRPVLCISTQLIEAGVDVDFGSVIRFVAGLDSIAQAAGRCNRHGTRKFGIVSIVNPADENLEKLDDIRLGRDAAVRVLDEFAADPASLDNDLLKPAALKRYFRYYFFARRDRMDYPVDVGHDDTLLNLLAENTCARESYRRTKQKYPEYYWRQSFKSAAEAFKAIDAPTQGLIVPYEQAGRDVIGELCATEDPTKLREVLRRAQRYALNVFPHTLERLKNDIAVHEAQPGTGILYVDPRYYSQEFGLDVQGQSEQPFLGV